MSDAPYTFSPRHSRGVLMGLGVAQLVAMGGAILGALVCVLAGLNPLAAVVCLALGLVVALVKTGGRHLHAWVGPLGHFGLLPRHWRAPLTTTPRRTTRQAPAPE